MMKNWNFEKMKKWDGGNLRLKETVYYGRRNLWMILLKTCMVILVASLSSVSFAQSYPGSFARIGLNAKGMALGNSISAMTEGNVYTYYNPALASFQENGSIAASVALMSLSRQLNVLTYTQGLRPAAGLSLGVINATVSNIDGRNSDGVHTSNLSTSENLVFLSFANQFTPGLSVGLSLKLYYYDLYSGITSTSFGFDLGGVYQVTQNLSVALVATDLGESYHWDSSSLYGTSGSTFTSQFPHIFKVGAAYNLPLFKSSITAEYDIGPSGLSGLRAGLQYAPFNMLALRAGLATANESYVGTKIWPSFGFGARIAFLGFTPELNYAYTSEPFTPYGIQTLTLILGF